MGIRVSAFRNNTSMLEGSIWKGLVSFAIPIFLGNLFQQLYTTADTLIVGNFIGKEALAAVSTRPPTRPKARPVWTARWRFSLSWAP